MKNNILLILFLFAIFVLVPLLGLANPSLLGPMVLLFWWLVIIGGVLFAIYLIVKKAVKDALREYDKEKAAENGPK